MITKEIARLIYNCYSEIENSEKMIETMKEAINEKGEFELKDDWRGSKFLTLHIPKKDSGAYSIHQLPHELALNAILAHVEKQKKELERLRTVCKTQLTLPHARVKLPTEEQIEEVLEERYPSTKAHMPFGPPSEHQKIFNAGIRWAMAVTQLES